MLEWTGERFLPDVGVGISYEHYSRYIFALNFVRGKKVLDCPSGEGFGSHFLASEAAEVIGIDIDCTAVEHSNQKYKRENLKFETGNISDLGKYENEYFDTIVCLEGIEHVDEVTQRLAIEEFRRVLKPEGHLIISTPNKTVYSDKPKYKNDFHIKEFYETEFKLFLQQKFSTVNLLGQAITNSCVLLDMQKLENQLLNLSTFKTGDISFNLVSDAKDIWMYFVAVCSNKAAKEPDSGIEGSVLLDFERHLEAEVSSAYQKAADRMEEVQKTLELRIQSQDIEIKRLSTIKGLFKEITKKIIQKLKIKSPMS